MESEDEEIIAKLLKDSGMLARLTDAIESLTIQAKRIADSLDEPAIKETQEQPNRDAFFPWHDTRINSRVKSGFAWSRRARKPLEKQSLSRHGRPETFGDLLDVGKSSLGHGPHALQGVGPVSLNSIDVVMEEHGFGDEWKSS